MTLPRAIAPLLALGIVSLLLIGNAQNPASTPPPTTYSLSLTSSFAYAAIAGSGPADIRVMRQGSREAVDATVAPQPNNPKGTHLRHWFDLKAHKVYTQDLVRNTCSWMPYTPDAMPSAYDPLAYPPMSPEELAKLSATVDSVNGIEARILETGDATARSREWIAVEGHFPVKAEMPGADGKPTVVLEVKGLKYSLPPVGMLPLPANCTTQTAGVWNETGIDVHAEVKVEATAEGSADLKTGKVKGSGTVKPAGQPR